MRFEIGREEDWELNGYEWGLKRLFGVMWDVE
jgi:hypothetical protein